MNEAISLETINWQEFKNQFESSFGFKFELIEDPGDINCSLLHAINWINVDNWESMTDLEILNTILPSESEKDKYFIVSESTYTNHDGPFILADGDFEKFFKVHFTENGECLFNGDTLIVSFAKHQIIFFHHEGVYAVFIDN